MIPPATLATYLDRAAALLLDDTDPTLIALSLRSLAREVREARSTKRPVRTC